MFRNLALLVFCMAGILAIGYAQNVRHMPAGTSSHTSVIDIDFDQETVITAIWPRTTISLRLAEGETEKFRFTLGTTTVDTDLPLTDGITVSLRGSGLMAVQSATGPARLAVYQIQE